MLLRRFTSSLLKKPSMAAYCARRFCLPVLTICLALLAGCGSMPSDTSASGQGGDNESVDGRVIPPNVQTLYEQAVASMAAGDDMEASLRFQEFLLQYPDYPGAHVNLAIIHSRNNDDLAAEASITDALILDPLYPQANNQLGMLLRRQGKFTEAEAAYTRAVTADPDYALAHYNLGVLNDLYLQRLDAALRHYERYQEIVGEDKQVMRWIADLKRRVIATQRSANVTE